MPHAFLKGLIVVALIVLVQSGLPAATPGPWVLASSNNIVAVHTPQGVATAATLSLQIGCYEAQLQPENKMKFHYQLVERKIDTTPGHVCPQAITNVTVGFYEADAAGTKAVFVTTADYADRQINTITPNM